MPYLGSNMRNQREEHNQYTNTMKSNLTVPVNDKTKIVFSFVSNRNV